LVMVIELVEIYTRIPLLSRVVESSY